jgi:hypothetical protein
MVKDALNGELSVGFGRPLEMIEPYGAPDDEETLTDLWNPESMRRENSTLDVVLQSFQRLAHSIPRASPVVPLKIRDVLHQKKRGLVFPYDTENVVFKEVAPQPAFGAELLTGFREGLTRKPSAEDIVGRDVFGFDLAEIPRWTQLEISLVDAAEFVIDLAGKHALMTEAPESQVESSKTGE